MSEMIFRGKQMDNDKWIEGYLSIRSIINREVDQKTICQYTGMKDKNGTKIFEGDICRFREWSEGEPCWVGKIIYDNFGFCITGGPNQECNTDFLFPMSKIDPMGIEIIGNVYDNPKMMTECPSMDTIKKCPFCGNEPTLVIFKGKNGWRDRYAVICRYDEGGCGAEGGAYHSKEEAIEVWNRRQNNV